MPFIIKSKRTKLARGAIIAILCFILIMIIFGLAGEIANRHRVNQQIASLQRDIAATQSENLELSTLISSWESGNLAEKEAREKMGLKKEGETVVLISDPAREASSSEQEAVAFINDPFTLKSTDTAPQVGNPGKWFKYFFSK